MPSSATRSSTAPCQSRIGPGGRAREVRRRRGPGPSGCRPSSCRPAAWACQDASARSAAASASSRSSDSSPDSTATLRLPASGGSPRNAATTRSRSQLIFCSMARKNSPVPTNSCQRASTSPRSRVPSCGLHLRRCGRPRRRTGRPRPAAGRSPRAARPPTGRASGPSPTRAPIAPSRVWCTTAARLAWSAASAASQPRIGWTAATGSRPSASTAVSGHGEQRRVAEPAFAHHLARDGRAPPPSPAAGPGPAPPRRPRCARRRPDRKSQGTASA